MIAVVDDDPDIRVMVALTLGQVGFRVVGFDDGQSALEQVRERPRLILLDYMMPRLNGPGFLRARGDHPLLAGVPVVLISAYPELAEGVHGLTVGILQKPIDLDVLVECVEYHCKHTS
jgi:DNA-binding response OmpR family regulator